MDHNSAQIITVTLNPALDVSTTTPAVVHEHKVRCTAPVREPGGGGINVARVTKRLGEPATAVLVVGGSTGQQLVGLSRAEGLEIRAIEIAGETRQSISVFEDRTGEQFRFVFPGPVLDQPARAAVIAELEQARTGQGRPLIVISGSMPPGTPDGSLAELIGGLGFADVVVDTSGPALDEATRSSVLAVKPSVRELSQIVGRPLETADQVTAAAQGLVDERRVGMVLVSLGADGALLVRSGQRPVRLGAPAVRVRSAVGAGDSLVGGLAVGISRGLDPADAAALGVAAGSAAVLSEGSGLCVPADVDRLFPQVTMEEVNFGR